MPDGSFVDSWTPEVASEVCPVPRLARSASAPLHLCYLSGRPPRATPEWLVSIAKSDRVELKVVRPSVWRIWKTSRRIALSRPDGVIIEGGRKSPAVAVVLKAFGWRVIASTKATGGGSWSKGVMRRVSDAVLDPAVLRASTSDLESALSQIAAAVGRPGAGLQVGPQVTVVSTVLNEEASVGALVGAISRQLRDGDEFIVVDGGSTDGTREKLVRHAAIEPRLRFFEMTETNISGGRNYAIRHATNDIIACTDAGCTPASGWLDALRMPFAERDPPGLVAGIPNVLATSALERAQTLSCYAHPYEGRRPSLFVNLYGRLFGQVFDPRLPFARSLAFTVDAWRDAQGFPEQLNWVEDGVFGRRVAQQHRCLLSVDAEVSWRQRSSLRSTFRMYFRYGIGAAGSGDANLRTRDLMRFGAYLLAPPLLAFGGRRGRRLLMLGASSYYSLPIRRVIRHRAGINTAMLVPLAMAVKDIGKVSGEIQAFRNARASR